MSSSNDSSLTSNSGPPWERSRKSFFDLPPRIRINVDRALARGQTVVTRRDDREATKRSICRDRGIGLNLVFVSKACLAEAKPTLLSEATFDVDFNGMAPLKPEIPIEMPDFSPADPALLRAIEISFCRHTNYLQPYWHGRKMRIQFVLKCILEFDDGQTAGWKPEKVVSTTPWPSIGRRHIRAGIDRHEIMVEHNTRAEGVWDWNDDSKPGRERWD
ncbi:uncharacterized protein Z519_04916 [Cladophialophora bantiana CBS 173.52]|uniref:Uncharacterized protein n=1 Tax=Cladophialophora bantiana (strain ATCC 10958 / CBS 173.52 / CDC B-1940 / NIH 8579) TaxID=1442370 RepID=A0A0D2EY97_CLAB1|nr:uncharacterized protein Z519_04916 [Cladophialophora bantiana CBS 173.52]KIW94936.1 hypothetical protein Z519_04916 [Cladophialophora bantiana CBS 173.52]